MGWAIPLKPGLCSTVATISRDGAPPNAPDRIDLVAKALADALGVQSEFVGNDPAQPADRVYTIGDGRPVYLGEIGPSKRLDDWYAEKKKPSGEAAHYFSVGIDWRGGPRSLEVPDGRVAFPGSTRTIASNWPDGDAQAQKERLEAEHSAQQMAELAASLARAKESVDQTLAAAFPLGAVAAVAVAGLALCLYLRKD